MNEPSPLPEAPSLPEAPALPEASALPEAPSLPEASAFPEASPLPEASALPEAPAMPEAPSSHEPCSLHEPCSFQGRSKRDPGVDSLNRKDVIALLDKIRNNHSDTVVLKIKEHISSDINSRVLEEIIKALYDNRICQALYAQNLTKAMGDSQIESLLNLLRRKRIWCLNLGENYNVSLTGWIRFCKALPTTSVTHLYVSEHTISLDLKNEMRLHIRENRKKHTLHSNMKNINVILRCTNCWWNPINTIRHALDLKERREAEAERLKEEARLAAIAAGKLHIYASRAFMIFDITISFLTVLKLICRTSCYCEGKGKRRSKDREGEGA
jgi:hypothetical protein